MCKKTVKLIKKIDPFLGGDKILDKLGLPSVMGKENGLFADGGMFGDPIATATGSTQTPSAPPTAQDPNVVDARESEKRRRLAANGQGGTVLTGSLGLSGAAPTAKKTVLGA